MKNIAKEVAEKTKDAYSFDRYGKTAWLECAILFESWGLTAEEIEEQLRHKTMRWTADSVECDGTNTYPMNQKMRVLVLGAFAENKKKEIAEIKRCMKNDN